MARNIIVVISGIILSFLLFVLGCWFALKFTTFGKISTESAALGRWMEYKDIVAKYGSPFKAMENVFRIVRYCIFPSVSILTGIYVGLLSRKSELIVSAITLFPFVLLTISLDASHLTEYALAVFYLSLCCFATYVISKRRNRRFTASEIICNHATTPD